MVKIAKVLFNIHRNIHVRGQLAGAVISRFDASAAGQCKDKHLLTVFGVDRTEANGQHKLARLESNLYRPQLVHAELELFAHIDLGDKKLHVLLEVTANHFAGLGRHFIAIFCQPSEQAIGFFGR